MGMCAMLSCPRGLGVGGAENDNGAGGTGRISYAVNGTGPARAAVDGTGSDIKAVIDLLQRARARASGGRPRAGAVEQGHRAAVADKKDAWRAAAFHFGRMRGGSEAVWRHKSRISAPRRRDQKKIIFAVGVAA